ncbi:MAG: hypothetical protein ACFFA8_14565 [Promethearchaeota archaeon]
MTEDFQKIKIKKLELELELKKQELSEQLDKIDQLENAIMELEAIISKPDNDSYLQFQLKEMEKNYRELKDKTGLLRLENIRLKQECDEAKNNPTFLPIVEEESQSTNLKPLKTSKLEDNSENLNQEENTKRILIKCPECENQKFLKVPLKVINQSNNVTTINVPSGIICSHNFQVFVDKFFSIRGYQLADFEFSKIEYYESNIPSSPEFQEIINILRRSVDDREILGTAIFTIEGRVLYTSIPQKTLLDTIREFEIRNEKHVHSVIKMFLELKNQQKVCSETLEIQGIEFILVLIFSELVNFGIGNMLMRDIVKKLKVPG